MISHVLTPALTVSNMESSLRFYCDLLGFRVEAELPPAGERARWDAYHQRVCGLADAQIRVVYLAAPDNETHLELIEYLGPSDPAPDRPTVSAPRTAIVALGLEGSDAAVETLRAAGVEVLSDPVPYTTDDGVSSKTTYLYDPDGNLLCLFELMES